MSREEIEKAKEFMKFYKNHCLNRELANIENYETVNDGDFVYKNIETLLQYIDHGGKIDFGHESVEMI